MATGTQQLQAMFPQLVTTHVAAVPSPIPIHANNRPISVTWNGTTLTDIVYDDDDDDYDGRTDYDYAYGESFNMNDPSVRLQFKKCLQNCLQAAQHIGTATKNYVNQSKHATTTIKKHTTIHDQPTRTILYSYCFYLHTMRIPMNTSTSFLYTKYHTILHERSISTMITIYTAIGTTPPCASTRLRKSVQTASSSNTAPPRMIRPLHLHIRLFLH